MELTNNDIPLSVESWEKVLKRLGRSESASLEKEMTIKKLIKVAALEYQESLGGERGPLKGEEGRQFRLFLMIEHLFDNVIPTEAVVRSLFSLNERQASTLIQDTLNRYENDLSDAIRASMKSIMLKAQYSSTDDLYYVVIHSANLLARFNKIIEEKGPTLARIKKRRGSASEYEVTIDTKILFDEELA